MENSPQKSKSSHTVKRQTQKINFGNTFSFKSNIIAIYLIFKNKNIQLSTTLYISEKNTFPLLKLELSNKSSEE